MYNPKGQLIKELHYDYQRRMRAEANKGLGKSGGCIVTEEDYEKVKSWEKKSEIQYQYDSLGKR